MAGRKPLPINLKSTSLDGEIRFFKTICEAARELGFSERGMGKAYHAGRNRIGEYKLEWLETPLEPDAEAAPRKRVKPRTKTGELKRKVKERMDRLGKENIDGKMPLSCTFCGLPLGREDRSDYISMARLDDDGKLDTIDTFDSMYKASKATGISWDALWNAREKGNTLIIRRKDKVPFEISWSNIHPNCFEARKEERRLKEREQELREEANRRKMSGEMTEEERIEFKGAEEEERDKKDREFEKLSERVFCKDSYV